MLLPEHMNTVVESSQYFISLREIIWGGSLVALTMAIHGVGMLFILRANGAMAHKIKNERSIVAGLFALISAVWLLLLLHLFEIAVWSAFLYWKQAFPNFSICFYFALNEYTTIGSNYYLPQYWRLLEGMLAMSGLLTFAWTTGVLFTFAQEFQTQQMQNIINRRHAQKAKHDNS